MAKSDVEFDDLNSVFSAASQHVRTIISKLNEEQMLHFYGLYKQATEGPCDKPKPSWYKITEKQKWESWSALQNLDNKSAMEQYVDLLTSVDPDWQKESGDKKKQDGCWVHHSVLKSKDEEIDESSKTIFDWVKENDLPKVRNWKGGRDNVDRLDEDGLGLLHWAADRGNLEIVRHFVENLKADVNVRDVEGQTPLHYASSCGHADVVKHLIDRGADVNVLDGEKQSPLDVANNSEICDLLKDFVPK